MQQNRLTVMGLPRLIRALIQRQHLDVGFRHVELLEQLPGRYALQFESVTDPFINLQKLSRQKPGLIFLLDYERRGIKGLAKLHRGVITRHELNY